MARIGKLSMGGRGAAPDARVMHAVAFDLSHDPARDFLFAPDGTSWEVEIKAGQRSVVARTPDVLDRSELLAAGLEYAQRSLDIVSFETRSGVVLVNPGGAHVLLFARGDHLVLQDVGVSDFGVSSGGEEVVRDALGNAREQPLRPPVWTPGLRFYRLSQGATDLHDAYRNLFLGLEALLDTAYPKRDGEHVRDWLLRALSAIAQTAGLQELVPKNFRNPAAYIVCTQYDRIRLRLFHANPSARRKTLNLPDPEEITKAYESLVRIFRQIAQRCFAVRVGDGGAMTYAGFKMMMDAGRPHESIMLFSEDDSPPKEMDTEISPLGKPVLAFDNTTYLSEAAPGRVAFVGSMVTKTRENLPVIHRIALTTQDTLLLVTTITGGLEVSGVDIFESQQTIRLQNLGLPKTTFGYERT